MATDLRSSPRQSVRRCLFGKPDRQDKLEFEELWRRNKEHEQEAKRRFKRKWNLKDEEDDGFILGDSKAVKAPIVWSRSNDIPQFYTKGYIHKCKKRALSLTPCVGKQLHLKADCEESCEDVRTPTVKYLSSNSVEVLIGRLSHEEPPSPPIVPTPVRCNPSSPASPVRLSRARSVSQSRLTDLWPIRKRARSVTDVADSARHSKRERMEEL